MYIIVELCKILVYKACMLDTQIRQISQKVIAAVILAPLMLVLTPIVAIINAQNGIGTFFSQERYGQNGKKFKALKFKTMRDGDAPDEERVTSLGRFMRKSSLDELPQLINILKGDMDLVGWRPLIHGYHDIWDKHESLNSHADQAELVSVKESIELIARTKPGLLGVIQISPLRGKYESVDKKGFREIVELEKQYVRTRQRGALVAAWQDAKVISIAPYAILKYRGHVCRQHLPAQTDLAFKSASAGRRSNYF